MHYCPESVAIVYGPEPRPRMAGLPDKGFLIRIGGKYGELGGEAPVVHLQDALDGRGDLLTAQLAIALLLIVASGPAKLVSTSLGLTSITRTL